MVMSRKEEPPIAGGAAIRFLKQQMAKKPIFDAATSRTEELFAAAMGTTRDLRTRSGLVHGKIPTGDANVAGYRAFISPRPNFLVFNSSNFCAAFFSARTSSER